MNNCENDTAAKQDTVEQTEYQAKSLAYYEHLLDSWLVSRMEYDKSLLLLSTGAIGLLATLLITLKSLPLVSVILLLSSGVSFLITSITIIHIFEVNADYIKYILLEREDLQNQEEQKLTCLRKLSFYSFCIGIVVALLGSMLSVVRM